jgi:hypothetical protein
VQSFPETIDPLQTNPVHPAKPFGTAPGSLAAQQGRHPHRVGKQSDDDLLSLEELSRTALRPKISTEASKTESTVQRLEPPALDGAGLQVNRTQSGSGERQGDSRGRRTGCPSC